MGTSGTPRTPATVAIVLQDLLFGGSQRHALELARGLDRERFAPEFWMMAGGADFAGQASQSGAPLVWLSTKSTVTPGAVAALCGRLRRHKPDIVLPLTAVPNIWARSLGRLTGAGVVLATCRGGGAVDRQHERLLAGLAHHHAVNTQALKDQLLALGRRDDQVSVIANGVDTVRFAPPAPEFRPVREVVLCVARLVEDKDHKTLLQAFDLAARQRPEAELWLVGDGPLKIRLERLARGLPSRERIRFFPGGDEMAPFYQQASVLALTSLREGLPNVILEAMASGLPVAATAVGGVPEVVEHAVTGLLSPAQDAEAFAASLTALLGDEERRLAMGEAARQRAVSRYSLRAMVAAHEALFDRLLGRE
ncbi:hypothetical protein JCM15519_16160 [Fundidesulfovibrio butyratiphilus]